ncbi:hypothetical protein PAXRUDRAFT_299210 [Paxillus rubicundulus Ve08.2h10]|uniref:Unplaced genomic scaffold scaffold_1582, whole genome shotgun sequence n=1 Tax=Paxillus rubicundulus Ve08.2h10 TaxID=930991 RepID=A0A0D0C7U8_9AGAM|nr:hypothetical protein PAXRUDRAFT_299210 [Paxillus rubicundulus Ve08.2h10]
MGCNTTVDCTPVKVVFERSSCALVCTTTYYCTSSSRYIFNGSDGDMSTKAHSISMLGGYLRCVRASRVQHKHFEQLATHWLENRIISTKK